MTTFLLVRHGVTDAVGKLLAGRTPGWHLNKTGIKQAQRLAHALSKAAISGIYTSPLERTIETAEVIGAPHGIAPSVREELGELGFGRWEGQTFEELNCDPEWRRFNTTRTEVRPPGGELMIEAQARMVSEIERLHDLHRDGVVVVVSHGDPLRALIAHYLLIPLDYFHQFEISPGSVSMLRVSETERVVFGVNYTGEISL
jgi:probable phosphoglycerate mutase